MPVAPANRTERSIELFHALSDETRLEIIGLLRGGERCVCELTDTLDAAQSRLSFHLRVLKDAGARSIRGNRNPGLGHEAPRGAELQSLLRLIFYFANVSIILVRRPHERF
jgi:DNA-binding transcriptional ArsR family regulator